MAKFGNTLNIRNLNTTQTFQGKSFLIYNDSGCRKTRTSGTLPGATLHLSLDTGSESAMRASEMLGIKDATHHEVRVDTLIQLNESLDALLTKPGYKAQFDTIVLDNLVEITSLIYTAVSNLPRYKKDQLLMEDIIKDNADKNAQSSKIMALYKDAQEKTRDIIKKFLSLSTNYNVILFTNYVEVPNGKTVDAGIYPQVNGPSSIRPMIMLFDEVYSTDFEDGVFDSKEKIETKFKISSFTSMTTGKRWFGKTRNIRDLKYLVANEIPADFRLIYKETGYQLKKTRKEDT